MGSKIKTIPKEWKRVKIKDVCKVVSGATPRTDNDLFWNGKINWLTPLDLSKNKSVYINSSIRQITEDGLKSCSAELVPENSLIMSSRAPIGYLAVNKIPSATNQGCKSFICSDEVKVEYLYYYLLGNIDQVKRLGSGSTFAEVGKKHLDELLVLLPPLKEQEKIGEILLSVDDEIGKVEQVIKNTEELKNGLMADLFVKGIGHAKFKKTELGEIPDGWEIDELGKVCDVRDGTHDSPKYVPEGIPLITSKNLVDNDLDFSNVSYISDEDYALIEKRSGVSDGDILFGMIGTIGNPVLVNKKRKFAIKNVALIKFNNQLIHNRYILYLLDSPLVKKQFSKILTGNAQKFIALGVIRSLKIIIPPKAEQERISNIILSIDEKIVINKKIKNKLTELKNGLMQDLLSGDVKVRI